MIHRWRANIFSFFIALLLLAGLPGCSGINSLFEKKEPVTLKFTYIENTADYKALADTFHQKNDSITITLDPVKWDQNVNRNMLEKAAEADAIRIPMTWVTDDLAKGFMPLDSFFTTDRNFPLDDLFPGSLEALKLDGRQVAIPAGIDPFVMYYIPKKFSDANVPAPAPNWQLEDFLSAAKAINNPDESLRGTPRFTYGFCTNPNVPDALMFAYLFGGSVVNNPNLMTAPTLNSIENIKALTWYYNLKKDYGLIPDVSNDRQMYMMIGNGSCGFWMDWMDGSFYGNRDHVESAMLPLPTYVTQFTIATLDGYSVMAKSQHSDAAWKWIRFLMENQTASGRLIPPLQSQVQSSEYAARASQSVRAVARSLPPQTILLGLEMYRQDRFQKVVGLFYEATKKVMDGTMAPKAALDEAQMQAEQVFK